MTTEAAPPDEVAEDREVEAQSAPRSTDVPPEVGDPTADAVNVGMQALRAVGRGTAKAAVWVASAASGAYHAIDPDVRRTVGDLPFLATTMLGPSPGPIAAKADDGHRPVVCVHGLGGDAKNFLPLRGVFALMGRTRVYAFGYDSGAPLEEAAEGLRAAVAAIREVNGLGEDARFDLVAHSMGGIVSRLAMLEDGFARRVASFVTLGTPHGGTLAARWLHTPRTLDLRPGSELMRKLEAQRPWPGPPALPKLVSIWSPADVLMLPADTARMEGAEHVALEGISHAGLLMRPLAIRKVFRALE